MKSVHAFHKFAHMPLVLLAHFRHLAGTSSLKKRGFMKFFAKCLTVFIVLAVLIALADEFWIHTNLPISGTVLYSAVLSLVLTLIYGWIDSVYIQHRQPGLKDK